MGDDPGVAEGKLVLEKVRSQILKQEREFEIYTPAGYSPKSGPYGRQGRLRRESSTQS